MEAVTTAYSRQAMRSILALDQRQRMQAVAVVEALAEQTKARLATSADPMEHDGGAPDNGQTHAPIFSEPDAAEQDDEEDGETATGTDDKETGQPGNGRNSSIEINLVPYGGNGELHLVTYGETGDLVVAIKDNSLTVMALIDVMQGLKGGADHD